MQGHQEYTKDHHHVTDHLETQMWHAHWKYLGFDDDSLIGFGC